MPLRPDLNDPENCFPAPRDIVGTPELTRGQKELALQRWRQVIEKRGRCQPRDVKLLEDIARALGDIEAQHLSVLPCARTVHKTRFRDR